jgi:hypothetical protein
MTFQSEFSEFHTREEKFTKDLSFLTIENGNLKSENGNLRSENGNLKSENVNLRSENGNLRSELSQKVSGFEDMQGSINFLNIENQKLKMDNEDTSNLLSEKITECIEVNRILDTLKAAQKNSKPNSTRSIPEDNYDFKPQINRQAQSFSHASSTNANEKNSEKDIQITSLFEKTIELKTILVFTRAELTRMSVDFIELQEKLKNSEEDRYQFIFL